MIFSLIWPTLYSICQWFINRIDHKTTLEFICKLSSCPLLFFCLLWRSWQTCHVALLAVPFLEFTKGGDPVIFIYIDRGQALAGLQDDSCRSDGRRLMKLDSAVQEWRSINRGTTQPPNNWNWNCLLCHLVLLLLERRRLFLLLTFL